jgi:hypothetical protein
MWVRVLNLPFNLRTPDWAKAIAKQIDKQATQTTFDPIGGFLRARVTVDVTKPLRRGILIDSAARKGRDWYECQYEQIPHFCFSCGRLGHSDLVCLTPGTRDANGNLPYAAGLRAPDERKKSSSNDNSSREQFAGQGCRGDTKFSSNVRETGAAVTSPLKKKDERKRKGNVQKQVYRRVGDNQIPPVNDGDKQLVLFSAKPVAGKEVAEDEDVGDSDRSKKRKTPSNSINSAEAVLQPCQSQ